MRIFKIIIFIFFILLIIFGIGFYIFLKNFDANVYKDQIAHRVGQALETTVEIGQVNLTFSFQTGAALDVIGLKLEDQGMLTGADVYIKRIQLAVDAVHFLKTREVVISHVMIKEPVVRVDIGRIQMREKNGEKLSVPEGSRDGEKSAIPDLFIQSVRLENGRVVILADGENIVMDVEFSDVNIAVASLSLGSSAEESRTDAMREPFLFQLTCAAFGSSKAVSARGKGWMDMAVQQVRLDDVVIENNLSDFSISQISETFPALKSLEIKKIQGNFRTVISQIVLGPDGIPVLVFKGSLTQAGILSGLIPAAISGGDIHFQYSGHNLDILESQFKMGSGQIGLKGRVEGVLSAQEYQFDIKIVQLALQDVLPKWHPEISFSGDLNGTVVLNGSGFQVPDIIENAKAQMAFVVANGKLDNFNLMNYVFDRISIIPDLGRIMEESLPEEYRRKSRVNQTFFEQIDVAVSLDRGVASYVAQLIADISELEARGSIDWHNQFIFKGKFALPQALSTSLVSKVGVFSSLMDNQQKVIIPLMDYNGPLKDFKLFPDAHYLAKMLVIPRVKDEIRGLLSDALGIKKSDSPDPLSEGQDVPKDDQKSSSQRSLFDVLLNSVFE